MAEPSSPGVASIPSVIDISKPVPHDSFGPVPVERAIASDEPRAGPSYNAGPSYHDYTENAPQAILDAIANERAREEKEGPPDMMVGSFQEWTGNEDGVSRYSVLLFTKFRYQIKASSRHQSLVQLFGPVLDALP